MARPIASGARVRPPPRPPGPWSRRSRWSRERRRPFSWATCAVQNFGRQVSGFCGRRWLPRRDHLRTWSRHRLRGTPDHERRAFGGDPRLPQLWFARAFGSTGCGLAAPTFRPVACRARRRGGRRAVVPGRPSKPVFEAVLPHAAGGNATTGIIVGVVSLCFSFSFPFDQQGLPCRSTSRSPVDSAAGR